jgi:hypothetical protein
MSSAARSNQMETMHPAVKAATLRGLHDMAQPLTVLHGSLELALMQVQTADEYRQWLEFALEQAERLVSNLEYVQQLVHLQRPARDLETFPVPALVNAVRKELQSIFAGRDIQAVVIRRGQHFGVRASYRAVQEALRLIFSSLGSVEKCRRVVVEIDDCTSTVQVQFIITDECGQPPASENTTSPCLDLQLAQTIVASTSGEMTLSFNPLAVRICLPSARIKTPTRKMRKKGDSIHV